MKKITLLAALFVAFAMNAQVTIWEDSFETYPDFAVDVIGEWTQFEIVLSADENPQLAWLISNLETGQLQVERLSDGTR